MRSGFKATLLLCAATLAVWHGVLLGVPHNHTDTELPQEELACSASHPLSQTSHLHSAGHPLAPHHCLACLAGTSGAIPPGLASLAVLAPSDTLPAMPREEIRLQNHSNHPPHRGPPSLV
jgi:hypothetical protein